MRRMDREPVANAARSRCERLGLVRARLLNRGRCVMKTCLVVDDSSVIRKVARRILEGLNFKISEAEDGQQALDECKREMPDAILLDWNMPVMDGYEFLKALRRMPE